MTEGQHQTTDNLHSLDDQIVTQLDVDGQIRVYLKETCKWAKFLSIVGFVFTGLMIIGGLSVSLFLGSEMAGNAGMPFNMQWLGLVYVVMALIYLAPTLYLFRFAQKTGNALKSMDQIDLQEGLRNLKSFFKFFGLFTAIVLGFYALILVVTLVGGGLASMF